MYNKVSTDSRKVIQRGRMISLVIVVVSLVSIAVNMVMLLN